MKKLKSRGTKLDPRGTPFDILLPRGSIYRPVLLSDNGL